MKQKNLQSIVKSMGKRIGAFTLLLVSLLGFSAYLRGDASIPPSPVTLTYASRNMTYLNVALNGKGNFLVVSPGEEVKLSFDWQLKVNTGEIYCPTCIVQFYYGIKDDFSNCFFSNVTPPGYQTSGKVTGVTFKAPQAAGVYYITQSTSLQYECKPNPAQHSNDFKDALGLIIVSGIPKSPVTITWAGRNITYADVSLNGQGNAIVASPGQEVKISFNWLLKVDSGEIYCPTCIVQFYYGIKDIFSNCFFSGVTSPGSQKNGTVNGVVFKAPLTPGVYYITESLSLQYQCMPNPGQHSNDFANALGLIIVF